MGITKVPLTVRNPHDPEKLYRGQFLVDSGAINTVVPATELKKIGISPIGEETFVLIDGKEIKRKVGEAVFQYNGERRTAPVIFGEPGDEKLLGVITLEVLGLSLDPLKRQLYKAKLRM